MINCLRALTPGIKYLILRVTARCNASCAFCLNHYYQPSPGGLDQELSVSEYELIARKLNGLFLLNLSGGEPHLREDLHEIASQFIKHSGVSLVSSPTNGSLPERVEGFARTLLKRHPRLVLKIDISLDGVSGEHNRIRGVENGFERALETAKRLRALRTRYRNLLVNANTTVTRENVSQLQETIASLKAQELFDEHHFTLARSPDRKMKVSDEEFEAYAKAFRQTLMTRALGFTRLRAYAQQIIATEVLSKVRESYFARRNCFDCVAGSKMLNVDEQGKVCICELISEGVLGNLRDHQYDLQAVLNSPQAKKRISLVRRAACDCHWECAISASLLFSGAGRGDLFLRSLGVISAVHCQTPALLKTQDHPKKNERLQQSAGNVRADP